jgi:hypothetical protein
MPIGRGMELRRIAANLMRNIPTAALLYFTEVIQIAANANAILSRGVNCEG